MFFLYRPRRQKSRRTATGSRNEHDKADRSDLRRQDSAPKGALDAHAWQKDLPQGADDGATRMWIKTLFDQVEQHVENFYKARGHAASEETLSALSKLESPHLRPKLQDLITRTKDPLALIKHCMFYNVLTSIDFSSSVNQSLLPGDFLAVTQGWKKDRQKSAKQLSECRGVRRVIQCMLIQVLETQDQAFSQWRMLTGFLRPDPTKDQDFIDHRRVKIDQKVDLFNSAFLPLVNRAYNDELRRSNLSEILQNASDTGIRLFSQPAWFVFDWSVPSADHERGSAVIIPACLKTHDNNGLALASAQVMIDRVLAKL